ncbi:uncharacterized protein LOC141679607 [Apium graveolens]|uniref:uncharacterized protein LOC141679607 n=1 Tax=Apium graveolens TaxID=4045 RepID=UPI003D7B38F9
MSKIVKDWIDSNDRASDEYVNGVESFLKFAYTGKPLTEKILCPCRECSKRYYQDRDTVNTHCIFVGFEKWYKNWTSHGEEYMNARTSHVYNNVSEDEYIQRDEINDIRRMVYEGFGIPTMGERQPEIHEVVQSDESTANFLKLLKAAETELWEGCEEFTLLAFVVELMHLKAISRWSNTSFNGLLKLLRRAMPKSCKIPCSFNEAFSMTRDLVFSYQTWDVCINHCMLYRNENEKLDECKICGASRYKKVDGGKKGNQTAEKNMWYFPLKPRLQRKFCSSKTDDLMRWHSENRVDDGIFRHPADSRAWKHFDEIYPNFASDVRNVRLGLAADGFNPFRSMSISHSTWPVIVTPYNLPPWLCMKQDNFILSVLTQGPKEPGNKIDVYLQPLIEELKELWEDGVQTYDASKNEMFTLRASLMWTINDFPGYANLSGWSTKGEYACPICNKRPQAHWLKNGRKWCYIGHRRFLPNNHNFRKDKKAFDGAREVRSKPKLLTGAEILQQVESIETEYKI